MGFLDKLLGRAKKAAGGVTTETSRPSEAWREEQQESGEQAQAERWPEAEQSPERREET